MPFETAASRYVRDWDSIEDDRKERGLDQQPDERTDREYVDGNGNTAVVKP